MRNGFSVLWLFLLISPLITLYGCFDLIGSSSKNNISLITDNSNEEPIEIFIPAKAAPVRIVGKKITQERLPFPVAKVERKPVVTATVETRVATSKRAESTNIGLSSVGDLQVGSSIDVVNSLFEKRRIYKVMVFDQRGRYDRVEIAAENGHTDYLILVPDCSSQPCKIKEIMVKSPRFSTARNFRVGNTLSQLMSLHNVGFLRWLDGNLVVESESDKLIFVLETRGIPKRWFNEMNINTLSGNTKIISIIVKG